MRKLIENMLEMNLGLTKNQIKNIVNEMHSQMMNFQGKSDLEYLNNNDAFLNIVL